MKLNNFIVKQWKEKTGGRKKKLEIAEAKKIRNNETRRRKTLLKVGSGTEAIMAGDLNRKDGFLAEIEGQSRFSKRKKETNNDDQNISENNPQEIVLEQVNVSDADCWSNLQLSHNRTSRLVFGLHEFIYKYF